MRKNLFLTCALALASFVGVQAQSWSYTLATGTAGKQITHEVNGASVTQYRAETKVYNLPEATSGIRYTVIETGALNQIKGGGPCFAMAELIVLNANGDTIPYTATTNSDHNTMGGAGNDGAGIPALNDGNLNNYFHSIWNDANAPAEYHYIEMELEQPVEAFKLVWYTRPNQHQNRPLIIGLTPAGETFTELFGEYQYSLGEKVNNVADLADENAFFTFYADDLRNGETFMNGENEVEGPGSVYISLSGYDAGDNTEATPKNILQLIPGNGENTYVVYQPLLDSYYARSDAWTDGYNGVNGWQRAYSDPQYLAELTFTQRADGDYEISYEIEHEGEPVKVWIGYEIRGQLKIFPEDQKALLEARDFEAASFGYPVDFGFTIYKANVADGLIEHISVAEISENIITPAVASARELIETWGDHEGYAEEELPVLNEVIEAAEAAVAENDLAGIFAAKEELGAAVNAYMAARVYLYYDRIEDLNNSTEFITPPYSQADQGKHPESSKRYLEEAEAAAVEVESNYETMSTSAIVAKYEAIEALLAQFEAAALHFSTFPSIVTGISDATSSAYPNNAVWNSNEIVLNEAVDGIRLTVLANYAGSAAGEGLYGGHPMVALGELKLYNQDGEEIALTEEDLYASAVEQNEGFESGAARLCDGVWGQGDGTTAEGEKASGSYFHSPWGGTAPAELVHIEVSFPEPMSVFSVELYSRDKSTTGGKVSLWPKELAITEKGEAYDPLLFAENPYNVFVGEQVTDASQITADGLYVIKGLLNTSATYGVSEETGEPTGVAKFYNATSRFHNSEAAVRANCVYRILPNGDGTYKVISLYDSKYWPTSEGTGFVSSVISKSKAANLKIVPANTEFESSFVLYEEHADLVVGADSIDTDEDGVYDAVSEGVSAPYVVYMDWYSGLATRPVSKALPREDLGAEILDSWGDSLHFNKGNGEGEWQIFKVTMDNPDFYWLTNMVGIVDGLGLEVGPDPGCVESLGELEAAYEAAQTCVADSVYADASAVAAALADKIALAETLEKNPMKPGVYMLTSVVAEFEANQGSTKSIYVEVDEFGTASGLRWGNTEADNIAFYFDFQPSEDAAMLVEDGTLTEEQAAQCYSIRAIGTTAPDYPYYIGEAAEQSVQIDPSEDWPSNYVVLPANGSAFKIASPANLNAFCIHANGHGGGNGTGGNLVYWSGDAGASQWRIVAVDYETAIEDLVATEGSEVVSTAYYTVGGASSSAPVKGINIVKVVYANGVVETKKVFVK